MSKLFSRASVAGAILTGADLKTKLVDLWDALSAFGLTDSNRVTVTASATLLTTQCGWVDVDCSAGSVVLTLPASGTAADEAVYRIRRKDGAYANTLTVQRSGTDTIEGANSAILVGAGGQVNVKLPAGASDWKISGRGGATAQAAREALGVAAVNYLDNADGAVYQRAVAATADDAYADDRWYVLTQTGAIMPAQLANPADGFRYGLRLTQSLAGAQRMGRAQIVPGVRTAELRGKVVTAGGPVKLSTSATVRCAILAWTGTEDAVTSDVVNNWTSATFATGSFFLGANLVLVATNSKTLTAATADSVSATGAVPSNAANLVYLYWTEAAAAQNVTLDAWGQRIVEGATLVDCVRRSEQEELLRCQRHYQIGRFFCADVVGSSGTRYAQVVLSPAMRATPAAGAYANAETPANIGGVIISPLAPDTARVTITPTASNPIFINAYAPFSADL